MSKCPDAERCEATVNVASSGLGVAAKFGSPARAVIEETNPAQALEVRMHMAWRKVREAGSAELRDS